MNPVSLWRPPLYEVPWALNPHDHFYFERPIAADEVKLAPRRLSLWRDLFGPGCRPYRDRHS